MQTYNFPDIDFDAPDLESQLMKRINKIDETMRRAAYDPDFRHSINERSLNEMRNELTRLHQAYFSW